MPANPTEVRDDGAAQLVLRRPSYAIGRRGVSRRPVYDAPGNPVRRADAGAALRVGAADGAGGCVAVVRADRIDGAAALAVLGIGAVLRGGPVLSPELGAGDPRRDDGRRHRGGSHR